MLELILLMIAGVHLLGLGCVAVLMMPALREGPDDAAPAATRIPTTAGATATQPRRARRPSARRDPAARREPARVRLRDHRRLAERLPRRERRPAREPDRRPVRSLHGLVARRAGRVALDPLR